MSVPPRSSSLARRGSWLCSRRTGRHSRDKYAERCAGAYIGCKEFHTYNNRILLLQDPSKHSHVLHYLNINQTPRCIIFQIFCNQTHQIQWFARAPRRSAYKSGAQRLLIRCWQSFRSDEVRKPAECKLREAVVATRHSVFIGEECEPFQMQ